MKKHHWYVTYSFNAQKTSGTGAITMFTTGHWFPIAMSRDWIKKSTGSDVVVILDWRKISKQQRDEFVD